MSQIRQFPGDASIEQIEAEMAETQLMSLHEGNIARYRLPYKPSPSARHLAVPLFTAAFRHVREGDPI